MAGKLLSHIRYTVKFARDGAEASFFCAKSAVFAVCAEIN